MYHTIKHHIKTTDLFKQLGIRSIEDYYHTHLLRWAGHVARMDFSRTPRKRLTGFLEHSRPTGRPQKTWGQTLTDTLKDYEIDGKTWMGVDQDRYIKKRKKVLSHVCTYESYLFCMFNTII
jgi:hypothetical protein